MVYKLLPRRWESSTWKGWRSGWSGWHQPRAPAEEAWRTGREQEAEELWDQSAAPAGLTAVKGPVLYKDKDGYIYNQALRQVNKHGEVVHARGSRGGKKTDPKDKCSYPSDHRPFVFDPYSGKRVRPQERRTEDCRRGQSSSDSWKEAPTASDGAEDAADGAWGDDWKEAAGGAKEAADEAEVAEAWHQWRVDRIAARADAEDEDSEN